MLDRSLSTSDWPDPCFVIALLEQRGMAVSVKVERVKEVAEVFAMTGLAVFMLSAGIIAVVYAVREIFP